MSNVSTTVAPASPQGQTFTCQNDQDRFEAIDQAFDYRGDITLSLANGNTIEGYIFNRNKNAKPPQIQIYLKGEEKETVIPYADIRTVAFTGRDTADGKSWQDWANKKESDRLAEAEKIKQQVAELGHL